MLSCVPAYILLKPTHMMLLFRSLVVLGYTTMVPATTQQIITMTQIVPSGKKAAQLQLQTEINNNEEWDKFLSKPGLLVIDVYTGWCGPCVGMVTNLKKLKVELGGDNLHLAVAKSDTIDCLERFRNRSEPTWLFVSDRMLLNVMFGANAPKLTRLIKEELRNEELYNKGELNRPSREVHQLTPLEQEIADKEDAILRERIEMEERITLELWNARRTERADLLEPYIHDVCPMLVWPHAIKNIKRLAEPLEIRGIFLQDKYPILVPQQTQKAIIESDEEFEGNEIASAALNEKPAMAVLFKKIPEKEGNIIEMMNRILKQELLIQRGDEYITITADFRNSSGVPGFFIPADRFSRAVAIDNLFPKLISSTISPERPMTPPHIAMMFSTYKRRDIFNIIGKYPDHILAYGFYADENINEPKNIAVSLDKYDERTEKDFTEVMALKVARKGTDAIDELTELGPLYKSIDIIKGKEDCLKLFPPGYGVPPPQKHSKSKKKRNKRKPESPKDGETKSDTLQVEFADHESQLTLTEEDAQQNSEQQIDSFRTPIESDDDILDNSVVEGDEEPETNESTARLEDKGTSPMLREVPVD